MYDIRTGNGMQTGGQVGRDKHGLYGYIGVGRHRMSREGDTQGHKWECVGTFGHAFFGHAWKGDL